MRVDKLIIIAVYDPSRLNPDEVKYGAEALYHRYTTRPEHGMAAENVSLIEAPTKGHKATEFKHLRQGTAPASGQSIGIYLVGHGYLNDNKLSSSRFGGKLDGDEAVALLLQLPELKDRIQDVRKVALVACSISSSPLTAVGNEVNYTLVPLLSYLERMCQALQKANFRCLAAGWSDYISACFTANGTIKVYDEDGVLIEPLQSHHLGKKVALGFPKDDDSKKIPMFVTNAIRESQKYCYRITKDSITRISAQEWTDNPKLK